MQGPLTRGFHRAPFQNCSQSVLEQAQSPRGLPEPARKENL